MKSSFAKYLTAFVIIIFLSFLMLSGIITTMIRSYVTDETEDKLEVTSSIIVDYLEEQEVEVLTDLRMQEVGYMIVPIINFDSQYDFLITTREGKVILSTATEDSVSDDGSRVPDVNTRDGLGTIDIEKNFKLHTEKDGDAYLVHRGDLGGYITGGSTVFGRQIFTNGEVRGYVFALSSNVDETKLVGMTRSAVINSSLWVMLAAVIAIYFITERLIHPLRTMTGAAKKFAKGDFSARVTVYGKDEVAELAGAFNNMAESLDSLEKMRNSFLANVSHDLRTPMTTIAGFIEGIRSGAIPEEKHDYYHGVISAEVHRLSRLVTELLDIARLESGERKFNFVDFDIAEMARIILISFEQKIDEKRLEVEFDSECDELMVHADKDAIYQVLYNLCHNAIKFANEKGMFKIKLERTQGKKIKVSVFDEGKIIEKEDLKLIFDRFYKTDKSRGLDKSGVGLGLYISKTIMNAHSEKIFAESVEGEGTTFIFTLPEGNSQGKRAKLSDKTEN